MSTRTATAPVCTHWTFKVHPFVSIFLRCNRSSSDHKRTTDAVIEPSYSSYKRQQCTHISPSCQTNMPLLNSLLSLVVLGLSAVPSVLSFQPGFNYGSEKVRGVNLGGWLVLEVRNPYILWYPLFHSYLALDHPKYIPEHWQQCYCRWVDLRRVSGLWYCLSGLTKPLELLDHRRWLWSHRSSRVWFNQRSINSLWNIL